jgi:cysteinyl-tRNA synthetase
MSTDHVLKVRNSLDPKSLVIWIEPQTELKAGQNRRLNWYSCGPTVYSHSHLGHARCYITFDVMRSILASQFNLDVTYVMNITDIDDKIINAANAQGIDSAVFARRWENDFFDVMQLLGVKVPDRVVRVSEYIPEILDYIKVIIDNGFAYVANGSVYFDVQEFKTEATNTAN